MQRIKIMFGFLFAALIAASVFTPSRATILFAGGEDIDFIFTGTVATDTTAGNRRTSYSRLALVPANSTTTDPPPNRFTTPVFANNSTLWVHAQTIGNGGNIGTTSNQQLMGVYGSDGVRRLLVRGTGTSSVVKISTRNTAGTIVDLVTCSASFPISSLAQLDWFIHYAVSGEVTLYANGVQFCDFVGDVTTNSVTSLDAVDFANANASFSNWFWSEVIVSTTDTRSMNLFTCAPQANGVNQNWTGNQTNVNGTTANDATPLTAGSSNLVGEFTCPSLPTGSFSVPAVWQTARALKGASGPANFRFIMRPSSGSTDFDSGSDIPLTTNFANYPFLWATNPACSCAWTTADITTGVNQGLKSRP